MSTEIAPSSPLCYGLGLLPPREQAAAIDRYRARYDGVFYSRTVPHCTVKQPFQLAGDEAALVVRVREVCRETRAFPVSVEGVGDFGHDDIYVVHLRVKPTPGLMAFQRRLVEALRDLVDRNLLAPMDHEQVHYLPHITLGQRLSPEERDLILAELALESPQPQYDFAATHVSVARRDPDMVWRRPWLVELETGSLQADPYPDDPPWPRLPEHERSRSRMVRSAT
ncbi:MAG: 2'-5' RNA ligase family protein [Chloroflexi bacterium]|nr:2'-5' RNA ligase family protein [Chloroflexota bacterium]